MPRDTRAPDSWSPPNSPESPETPPKPADTGSLQPIPEAIAWAERADAWAQRSEQESGGQVVPSRWSEVASPGRTAFPADGVGWRTETAEWRATEQTARWRQTTEWRSASGTHGWRSTTEAWHTGAGAETFQPPSNEPLAISSTAWPTPGDDSTTHDAIWQQSDDPASGSWQRRSAGAWQPENDDRPSWQQFAVAPQAPWDPPAPQPWQPPAPRTSDGPPAWQQLVDPTGSGRGYIDAESTRSVPLGEGRHLIREDDGAQWPRETGSVDRRVGDEAGTGYPDTKGTSPYAAPPADGSPTWSAGASPAAASAPPWSAGAVPGTSWQGPGVSGDGRRRGAEGEDRPERPSWAQSSSPAVNGWARNAPADPDDDADVPSWRRGWSGPGNGAAPVSGPAPQAGEANGHTPAWRQGSDDSTPAWRQGADDGTPAWRRNGEAGPNGSTPSWRQTPGPAAIGWRGGEGSSDPANGRAGGAGDLSLPGRSGDLGNGPAGAPGDPGNARASGSGDLGNGRTGGSGDAGNGRAGIDRAGERPSWAQSSSPVAWRQSPGPTTGWSSEPDGGTVNGSAPTSSLPRGRGTYGSTPTSSVPQTGATYGSAPTSSIPRSGGAYGSAPTSSGATYGSPANGATYGSPANGATYGSAAIGSAPSSGATYGGRSRRADRRNGADPDRRGRDAADRQPEAGGWARDADGREADWERDSGDRPDWRQDSLEEPGWHDRARRRRDSRDGLGWQPDDGAWREPGAETTRRRREAAPADPWAQNAADTGVIPMTWQPPEPDTGSWRSSTGAIGRARPTNPNRRRPGETSGRMRELESRPSERRMREIEAAPADRIHPDENGMRPGDTGTRMGAAGLRPGETGSGTRGRRGRDRSLEDTGTRPGGRRRADDGALDPEVYRREPGTRSGGANWPVDDNWRGERNDPDRRRRNGSDPDWRRDLAEDDSDWRRDPAADEDSDWRREDDPDRRADLSDDPWRGGPAQRDSDRRRGRNGTDPDWRRELADDDADWRRDLVEPSVGDAVTEVRQRIDPAAWQREARESGARGSASYREHDTGDWRRALAAESGSLADGESRRFGTQDFVPFKPVTAPVSAPKAEPAPTPSDVRERWEDAADNVWPPRQPAGYQNTGGAYERRPVTGGIAAGRPNNLLEPDDDELEEDNGGPLAAVGYTVIWYGVPVVLFVLYMLVLNGSQQAHALSTLAGAAPQFGLSLLLSMVVAVGLRKASGSWKAASVGLAAAVMGGGLATVLSSAITGNSLS